MLLPQESQDSNQDPFPAVELYLVEKPEGNKIKIPDLVWVGQGAESDEKIRSVRLGIQWLPVDGAAFPIVTLPLRMFNEWPGSEPAESIRTAMGRLNRMVSDLLHWADRVSLHTDDSKKPSGEAAVQVGQQHAIPWRGRLLRLNDLLFGAGQVQAVWHALMSDPVVRLESRYPTRPLHRARRPVLSGSRGPWTMAGGWSPEQPLGLVHDRVVDRTGDTPPNRLAVGLARLVSHELDAIRRDAEAEAKAKAKAETAANEKRWTYQWKPVIDRAQHAAESVLHSPVFRDVPLYAEVPLDSPALQNNARARKLLEAWGKLLEHLDRELDWFIEDVLTEPIVESWKLYERWCFVAICQVAESWQNGGGTSKLDRDGCWIRWEKGKTQVWLSVESKGDFMEDGEQSTSKGAPGEPKSWGAPSLPDGIIVRNDRAHAWDAKHRALTSTKRYVSGYTYQAHAYRDVLAFGGRKIGWSLVFHATDHRPTTDNKEALSRVWPEKELARLFQTLHGNDPGGVCLIPLLPPEKTDDATHIQYLKERLKKRQGLL